MWIYAYIYVGVIYTRFTYVNILFICDINITYICYLYPVSDYEPSTILYNMLYCYVMLVTNAISLYFFLYSKQRHQTFAFFVVALRPINIYDHTKMDSHS